MDLDKNAIMNEVGGAFMVSWLVLSSVDAGIGTLTGALILAAAWMAISGAHILPVVTWCHMMTGDLSDTEGNWMANGMRLVAQVIGAALAIVMVTEAGTNGVLDDMVFADSMNIADIADNFWPVLGMIAAGAIWWQIHTRCETAWVSAIALLGLGSTMTITGSHYMGASIVDGGTELANVLVNWITDGLFVGLGALLGVKIDEAIDNMGSSDAEEEEAAE